jgi:hypothetical protein
MQLDEFAIMGDAITVFGADAQQDKLLEEMAELQKEILKHRLGEDNLVHIAEEIADVEIMLEQMKMIFSCAGRVKAFRAGKLHRLEQRTRDARMEHAAEPAADPEVDHELFFGGR